MKKMERIDALIEEVFFQDSALKNRMQQFAEVNGIGVITYHCIYNWRRNCLN